MGHCAFVSRSFTLILNLMFNTVYNKCATSLLHLLSAFRREVHEHCALQRYYGASSGITERVAVILTDVSGPSVGPIFRGQESSVTYSGVKNSKGFLRSVGQKHS